MRGRLGAAERGRLGAAERGRLGAAERGRLAGFGAVVLALHAIGFFLLLALVVPHHFRIGGRDVFGLGLGITAYTLGLRHAFDADHITAIDNATRKLLADGRRPLGVGFFFSLGHSTVVFVLALMFAVGLRALAGPVQDDGSMLHEVTGLVGTSVSGLFLFFIAVCNVVAWPASFASGDARAVVRSMRPSWRDSSNAAG